MKVVSKLKVKIIQTETGLYFAYIFKNKQLEFTSTKHETLYELKNEVVDQLVKEWTL